MAGAREGGEEVEEGREEKEEGEEGKEGGREGEGAGKGAIPMFSTSFPMGVKTARCS